MTMPPYIIRASGRVANTLIRAIFACIVVGFWLFFLIKSFK